MASRFRLTEDVPRPPGEHRAVSRQLTGDPDGRGRGPEALLFATVPTPEERPAALLDVLGTSVLGRLLAQLASLGVGRAWVVTRPGWRPAVEEASAQSGLEVTVVPSEGLAEDLRLAAEMAAEASGPLVVANAHVVTHREALAGLLADPRIVSGVLATGSPERAGGSVAIRSHRARVVSAASPYHRVTNPTGYFLGLLKVDARDFGRLAASSRELARLAAERPVAWDAELERKMDEWRMQREEITGMREAETVPDVADDPLPESLLPDPPAEAEIARRRCAAADDAVSLLLVGLVRSDVEVFPTNLRGFFYASPVSSEAAKLAAEALRQSDEERVLLDSAVKANDGFFTTYLVSPYSKYLARFAARRGWTPNAVSAASFAVGLAAAASFALGSRAGLVAGALLLQVSFTIDCVDGQLARYTRTFSKLGAWLDSVFDRTKEYLVYAGLAVGSMRGFGDDVWLLAAAALTLQTARHMSDFAYVANQRHALAAATQVLPLIQPEDGPVARATEARARTAAEPTPSGPLLRLAVAVRRSSLVRWGNRIVRLPIGERFALISLTAALASPRVTFLALLAWGGAAAIYAAAVRVVLSYDVHRRVLRVVLG